MRLAFCASWLVCQANHAWRLDASAIDSDDSATTHREQLVFVKYFNLQTRCSGDFNSLIGKHCRSQVCRRHVCKIACHVCCGCNHHATLYACSKRCTYTHNRHFRKLCCLLINRLQVGVAMRCKCNTFDNNLGCKLAINSSGVSQVGCKRAKPRSSASKCGCCLAQCLCS